MRAALLFEVHAIRRGFMSQPEWFGPLDKLSWQIGQMALLFDYLLAFGVFLLALALAALVIQLIGLRQLMRAEKPQCHKASFQTAKPQFFHKERTALRAAPVRRKPL